MGELKGFVTYPKEDLPYRPIEERVRDFKEVTSPLELEKVKKQGARCMDCGIPTCHWACPVDNLIPDWNDLVYRDRWQDALERLHRTAAGVRIETRSTPQEALEAALAAGELDLAVGVLPGLRPPIRNAQLFVDP